MNTKDSVKFFIEDRRVAHVRLPNDYPNRQHSFELSHVELRRIADKHQFYREVSDIVADTYLFEPEIPEVL